MYSTENTDTKCTFGERLIEGLSMKLEGQLLSISHKATRSVHAFLTFLSKMRLDAVIETMSNFLLV